MHFLIKFNCKNKQKIHKSHIKENNIKKRASRFCEKGLLTYFLALQALFGQLLTKCSHKFSPKLLTRIEKRYILLVTMLALTHIKC